MKLLQTIRLLKYYLILELAEIENYLNTSAPNTLEMHFLPQIDVFRAINESGCACLEVREDGMVGHENLMLSNSFVIQKN